MIEGGDANRKSIYDDPNDKPSAVDHGLARALRYPPARERLPLRT
jgi:hypothetical protein